MFEEVQPVIGPYGEMAVAYRDFDPRSAEIARHVAGLISRHLPAVRAEHVGSTAVPGCGGRGIIDLLITCPEEDAEKVTCCCPAWLPPGRRGRCSLRILPRTAACGTTTATRSCCTSTSCPPARMKSIRFAFCGPACGPMRSSPGPMSSTSGRSFPAASPTRPSIAAKRPPFSKWFWADKVDRMGATKQTCLRPRSCVESWRP